MKLFPLSSLPKRAYRLLPRLWTSGLDLVQQRRHGGDRSPARLDVMTAIGGNDADVLQVLLLSLSEAHPRDRIVFWMFYLDLGPAKLASLTAFCDGLPNLTLTLVQVPEKEDFALLSKLGGRPFGARFLWLAAHLHLPPEMSRIIYLDPLDMIVTDDLLPLLHQPFLGRYLVACREYPHRPPLISRPARKAHARGASAEKLQRISWGIVNSGAIVLNLDKFRRDGITMGNYVEVGRWAQETSLSFGDQGLFSLTHGSDYTQTHDRYNLRFHDASRRDRRLPPAVIHFAGRIPKPYHLRLTPEQQQQVLDHLDRTGLPALPLNAHQTLKPHDLDYYRQWWEVCARTPVHDRIAPLAADYAARVLAEQGVVAAPEAAPTP